MIVAIPVFNKDVAPCFEAASLIVLNHVVDGKIESSTIEKLTGCEGFGRVRFIREKDVNVLICNGIKSFYRDLLQTGGVIVISNIASTADEALKAYLSGEFLSEENSQSLTVVSDEIPHDDLVCWSQELFSNSGYHIIPGSTQPAQLVDYIAEIKCPLCSKVVRIAVCCGSQTYRIDQEIKQFYHTTLRQYQAQVFVYPATSEAKQKCDEYGIELIDPNKEEDFWDNAVKRPIPIIQKPISGHERAFNTGSI